ncbi:unnamed protein product [Paramecium pentaurelia]|uniref:Protein-tyrosine-phosphatase n=1 Tax=Paramecium pentaurelia TaxID=43138 RepID=A0A8S1VQJ8_9CILI|nr:unnamed protein product [Paramecium pentaurelia]
MFVNTPDLSNCMNCIIAPLNGVGGIYLGNIDAAQNPDNLIKYQIGAVLSVIDYQVQIKGVQKIWIMAEDTDDFPLYKYYDQSIKFIDIQTLRTNVLIHCQNGISRSAAICAVYMMQKYQLSLNQTLHHIQQCRRLVSPNPGFIKQLKDFEQKFNPKDKRKRGSIIMEMNNKSRRSSVEFDNNRITYIKSSITNSILNQSNQKDKLSDFNYKLNNYMHQWKIRERAH